MKKNISEVDRLVLLNKEIRVGKFAFYDDNQSSQPVESYQCQSQAIQCVAANLYSLLFTNFTRSDD